MLGVLWCEMKVSEGERGRSLRQPTLTPSPREAVVGGPKRRGMVVHYQEQRDGKRQETSPGSVALAEVQKLS